MRRLRGEWHSNGSRTHHGLSLASNSETVPRPLPRISPAIVMASTARVPTVRAAVGGGYGAEGVTARVEVGAGEAMVDMAVIRLLMMQGLLKTKP